MTAAPTGKLSRYPKAYSRILLALDPAGKELTFTLGSEPEAHQERLRFYNFLKFARRNPFEVPHLFRENRINRVRISVAGPAITFRLRPEATFTSSLEAQVERLGLDPTIHDEAPALASDPNEAPLFPELGEAEIVPEPGSLLDQFLNSDVVKGGRS